MLVLYKFKRNVVIIFHKEDRLKSKKWKRKRKIIRKSGIPWDVSFLDFWKGYYRGWGCKKVQDYTENVRKNKPKTTKPQSEKSKLTPSNIVKPKQKRQNDWRRRQALVYNPLHNLAHATFMSVRIQNWQTLMMKQLQGQKIAVSVQFTPDSILSLWNMELSFVIWIIVLDSGYIAFPVAKVFLAVFNKLIE